jgi:hypothetical protein
MTMSQMPPREALARAVSHVTSTMLGFTVSAVDRPEGHLMWRTAALSIPGERPVCVALSSNEQGCSALGSALFSCPSNQVDASMIDDSLSELVNMTAGQIRMLMALDQALGLPRVGAGSGTVAVHEQGWHRLVLATGSIEILLSLRDRSY